MVYNNYSSSTFVLINKPDKDKKEKGEKRKKNKKEHN